MKKNKALVMAVAIASSISLVISGFANASVLNPYNTFKEALRKTLYVTNGTIEMKMTVDINNEYQEEQSVLRQFDLKEVSTFEKTAYTYDGDYYEHLYYSSPWEYFSTSSYMIEDGIQYYHYEKYDERMNRYYNYDNILDAPDEGIRLLMACMDAASGNLKNYMVEDTVGQTKQIRLDADESMAPELAKAFMGFMTSMINEEAGQYGHLYDENDSEFERKIASGQLKDIRFHEGYFEVFVNEEGLISAGTLYGEIYFVMNNGETMPASLLVEGSLSDVGSTVPQVPDFSDTSRYMLADNWKGYTDDPAMYLMNWHYDITNYNIRHNIEYGYYTEEQLIEVLNWLDHVDALLAGTPLSEQEEELEPEEKEPEEEKELDAVEIDGNKGLDDKEQEEPAPEEQEHSSEEEPGESQQPQDQEQDDTPDATIEELE